MIITDELLALFIEGRTTIEESATILAAAMDDMSIRSLIEEAIEDGIFFKRDVSKNSSAISVCQTYALHSRHLPIMRLAASSETNDCVVKCEEYVLNQFAKESQYKRLSKEARQNNWLQKEGTPLHNIGRLSELAGLSVSRRFRGTLEDIQKELEGNCSVIVALNAARLNQSSSKGTSLCDHAVVVTEIDEENNIVELYDPQSLDTTVKCPTDAFLKAWKTSKNFFVSIVERGVRPYTPHPEYVAHIKLPEDILPIADVLAENAHEIWAKGRQTEAEEKGEVAVKKLDDDPFMKPFNELTKQQRKADYSTAINTIKLLYKLGFSISRNENIEFDYHSNERDSNGNYTPKPIAVDDVSLPAKIEELTEYIAENTHEEWAKQRMKEGWVFAEKTNKKKKQSFDLVPYCELLDSEKEYDRKMAMNTLRVLYKIGYRIEKK